MIHRISNVELREEKVESEDRKSSPVTVTLPASVSTSTGISNEASREKEEELWKKYPFIRGMVKSKAITIEEARLIAWKQECKKYGYDYMTIKFDDRGNKTE